MDIYQDMLEDGFVKERTLHKKFMKDLWRAVGFAKKKYGIMEYEHFRIYFTNRSKLYPAIDDSEEFIRSCYKNWKSRCLFSGSFPGTPKTETKTESNTYTETETKSETEDKNIDIDKNRDLTHTQETETKSETEEQRLRQNGIVFVKCKYCNRPRIDHTTKEWQNHLIGLP